AEDGRVGADAERKREHCHRGEGGALGEGADGVAEVLEHGIHLALRCLVSGAGCRVSGVGCQGNTPTPDTWHPTPIRISTPPLDRLAPRGAPERPSRAARRQSISEA